MVKKCKQSILFRVKLMKYVSTKTYGHERGLSCAFRQPNAESHCKYIHGYALSFTFVFGCNELDNNNWVVDFGSLKTLKNWLEETFDHKLLIDKNDPQIDQFEIFEHSNFCQLVLVDGVGCEKFAEQSLNFADKFIKKITDNRCWVESVEVKEHGSNSAIVMRDT